MRPGFAAFELAERGVSVCGIDISPVGIDGGPFAVCPPLSYDAWPCVIELPGPISVATAVAV